MTHGVGIMSGEPGRERARRKPLTPKTPILKKKKVRRKRVVMSGHEVAIKPVRRRKNNFQRKAEAKIIERH